MAMIHIPEELMQQEVAVGTFAITAEQIRGFAEAVGDLNPLYLDPDAARQAGYPDVIAPPTFCMHLRGGKVLPEVPLEPGLASLHAGQELNSTMRSTLAEPTQWSPAWPRCMKRQAVAVHLVSLSVKCWSKMRMVAQ